MKVPIQLVRTVNPFFDPSKKAEIFKRENTDYLGDIIMYSVNGHYVKRYDKRSEQIG